MNFQVLQDGRIQFQPPEIRPQRRELPEEAQIRRPGSGLGVSWIQGRRTGGRQSRIRETSQGKSIKVYVARPPAPNKKNILKWFGGARVLHLIPIALFLIGSYF